MTEGPILPQMIGFALPLLMGLLFQQLYNTVDSIVVGRFVGTNALAAVNGTAAITNILISISSGLSTGASVVIAQCYGARDEHRLSLAVHTIIGLTLLMGVLSTGIGLVIVDPMLRLMSTPKSVYQDADAYVTIYFSGILWLFIYNMGSGILRAVGDSKRPLMFLIFSAAFNIVFDLLFVAVFHWGVAGAAWATVIAELLSSVLVLYVLTREEKAYGLRWKKICLNKEMVHRVLAVGMPHAVQQVITSFSNVFVQSYINFFDAATMAAWGCYIKVDHLLFIPMSAIGTTLNTFVGQNYGAGNRERSRQGVHTAICLCLGVTLILSMLTMLLAAPLMRLFTEDEQVVKVGVSFLMVLSPLYLVHVFNQMYASALRGINLSTPPTILMLLSFVLSRQIYLFIVSRVHNTEIMIGLGYPVGWLIASILVGIYFYSCPYFKKNAQKTPA